MTQPARQPVDAQSRKRLSDAMQQFLQTYDKGYKILLDELKKNLPRDASLKSYQTSMEKIRMLDTPEKLATFLNADKPLSELLGFSPEVVETFYEQAYKLIEQKRYNDAKDAFFFLVTVAPQMSESWLGLGFACGHCEEPEGAIQSYLNAIALSPHKADGYIAFARLCTAIQDFSRAEKVCDIGMRFAQAHEKQAWAKKLGDMLEEAKKQIAQLVRR